MSSKMKVTQRQISELIPAHYNPRRISDADFEALKTSLSKFTAVEPAIVNTLQGRENIIVGGHQRIKAAKALGWETFPCVEVQLTEADERELNIRLNRNTGEFDMESLLGNFDIDDLVGWGFNASELGRAADALDLDGEEAQDIATDDADAVNNINRLSWDGKTIMLSEEELAKLNRVYDSYMAEVGIAAGFVNHLLGGR